MNRAAAVIMALSRASRSLVLLMLLSSTLYCAHQETPNKEDEPAKDVILERLGTAYRFENDGTGEMVQSACLRVLTEAGRKGIGQIYFPYSSGTQDLRIDFFRTLKSDGSVVAADPEKALEIATPVSRVAPSFTDLKLKGMVAPNLEVGDALEYQYTTVFRSPLKPGDFWMTHYANRQLIVQSETVTLDVPADRSLSFKTEEGIPSSSDQKAGRKTYRWEFSNDRPRKQDDPPQDPLFSVSTFADWAQVGEWYLTLQSGRSEVTPEIQALAAQLAAGKNSPREKLEAIYAHVSKSVRYVNIAFGIGGFQAHPADEVLRNGYGDCKDKHGLFAALLAAVGLKAFPVLMNSERGVVEPAVPVPNELDHVISAVPLDGELLWMDTTTELAPLGLLTRGIRGKKALLMEPGAIRLAEIPSQSPVPEQATLVSTGKLDATGKLTMANDLSLRGLMEVPYRQIFQLGNKQAIEGTIKYLGRLQVSDGTAEPSGNSDPTDLSKPFEVKYQLTKTDFFAPLDRSKEVSVPNPFVSAKSWDETLQKAKKARTTPVVPGSESGKEPEVEDLELGGPFKIDETFDLELDPIYEVDLPLPVRVERPFATYESSYSFEQGHLRARRILNITRDKLSPERWQDLDSFAKLIERDLNQNLTLRRTGTVDLLSRAEQMSADDLNTAAASLLEERREFSLARDLLLKATAKDPQHKWAWNNLGRAYASLGSFPEAEKAYKKQLEVNPNDEYTYKNLGWLYSIQRRHADAVAALRRQIEINPFDKDVYTYLGSTLGQMEKWDEAAQAYEKSAAINRDKADVYIHWGDALLKAGKTEDGRKQLERALEIDSSATSLNNVAYYLAESGVDLDRAEQHATQAVEIAAQALAGPLSLDVSPDYTGRLFTLGAYLDTLGWVYFQQGKPEKAEPILLAAHQLQPTRVVSAHLARTYARLDRLEEAIRYFAFVPMAAGSPPAPGELKKVEDYVNTKPGGADTLAARLAETLKTVLERNLIRERGVPFTWPLGVEVEKSVFVEVVVLADPTGAVADAKVLEGDERFRDAALADARKLRLPPLAWPGHSLPTVRTISFLYRPPSLVSPDKRVKAFWGLGKPPAGNITVVTPDGNHLLSIPASIAAQMGGPDSSMGSTESAASSSRPEYTKFMIQGALLMVGRDVDGAISNFRQAIQLEPNCARCHSTLAEALAQKGDRAAAIAEYQEVARLEPDNPEHHFMLGAQYEAEAATEAYASYQYDPKTRTSRPRSAKPSKAAQMNYESALEEYRRAHELAPTNPAYKDAYTRLQKQLKRP